MSPSTITTPCGEVVDHEPEPLLALGQIVEAVVQRPVQRRVLGVRRELVGQDGHADAGDQRAAHAVVAAAVDEAPDADAEGGQGRPVAEQRPPGEVELVGGGVAGVGAEAGEHEQRQAGEPQQIGQRAGAERRLGLVVAVDAVADGHGDGADGGQLQRPAPTVEHGHEGHRDDDHVADRVGQQHGALEAVEGVVVDDAGDRRLPDDERRARWRSPRSRSRGGAHRRGHRLRRRSRSAGSRRRPAGWRRGSRRRRATWWPGGGAAPTSCHVHSELAGQPRRGRGGDERPAEMAGAGRPPRGGGHGERGHHHLADIGHGGGDVRPRCRRSPARWRRRPGTTAAAMTATRKTRWPSPWMRGRAIGGAHEQRRGARTTLSPRPHGHRRHPIQATPRWPCSAGRRPARRATARTGTAISRISRCMARGTPDSSLVVDRPLLLPPWRRRRRSSNGLFDSRPRNGVERETATGRNGPVAVPLRGLEPLWMDQVGPYQPDDVGDDVGVAGEVEDGRRHHRRRAWTSPGSARSVPPRSSGSRWSAAPHPPGTPSGSRRPWCWWRSRS